MTDTQLLKFARARDHQDFIWRVTAALTVKAQYMADVPEGASVEGLSMRDWVLDNPMVPIEMMTAFAATMPEIAEKVTIDGGTVDTAQVLDTDISYIVGSKWDSVARHRFADTP
ncbi:hypothetical protein [Arthrobacter glacialis]|uniref:hypothetical protein n=1 Tax=Arthrobacter glacialis TaxID=1664 RepID=UPI000CD408F9|nr:hypothetical protein [Arthrobacter glacialis]POH58928.1 hypothetical protein CVS28_09480 [Arthrobacter glacialis]